MTHTHTFFGQFATAVIVMATLSTSPNASAQTPRFRLTPLVKLGFPFDADTNGTAGINNKGQVVYGYKTQSNAYHAWLWMPASDYGLAAGFHDLTTISESDEPAIARDINESGYIVGQSDGISPGSGRMAVWHADQGDVSYFQLGALSAGTPWSGAHAINDDATPTIVGVSGKDDLCECSDGQFELAIIVPISVLFNGTNTLVELTSSPDTFGEARDINTPTGQDPLRITGYTDCSGTKEASEGEPTDPGMGCRFMDICRTPMDAVVWSPSTRNALTDLGSNGARGRGVNDAAQIAGWGFTDESTCRQRSLYWASPAASPVNLGNTMPSGQSGDQNRAEALNGNDPPQVVGWNLTLGFALLWENPEDTTPIVTDLNSAAAIGGCASAWTLTQAHDINDSGWIITRGREDAGNQDIYAILLTPFPACAVDISGDGCVNVTDMLAVISGWGNCQVGVICSADTNGDCTINVTDLNAVIAAWGCDPCGESLVGGGGSPPSLEEVIVMILEAPVSAVTQAEIIEALLNSNN